MQCHPGIALPDYWTHFDIASIVLSIAEVCEYALSYMGCQFSWVSRGKDNEGYLEIVPQLAIFIFHQ